MPPLAAAQPPESIHADAQSPTRTTHRPTNRRSVASPCLRHPRQSHYRQYPNERREGPDGDKTDQWQSPAEDRSAGTSRRLGSPSPGESHGCRADVDRSANRSEDAPNSSIRAAIPRINMCAATAGTFRASSRFAVIRMLRCLPLALGSGFPVSDRPAVVSAVSPVRSGGWVHENSEIHPMGQ